MTTALGLGFLDAGVHQQVISVIRHENHRHLASDQDNPLTAREQQVLRLAAVGNRNKEVAGELCISEGSVKQHINRILTKVGATRRVKAVTIARQPGWI